MKNNILHKKNIISYAFLFLCLFLSAFQLHSKENHYNFQIRKLNNERFVLLNYIEQNFNKNNRKIIPGTHGVSVLNELVWVIDFLNTTDIHKLDTRYLNLVFKKLISILKNLILIKENNPLVAKWQVTLNDIDISLISNRHSLLPANFYQHIIFHEIACLQNKFKNEAKSIIILSNLFKKLDKYVAIEPKPPSRFKRFLINLKINYLVTMILNRGILAPNCTWFFINDVIVKDKSGVDLYIKSKELFKKPIVSIKILNKEVILVNDHNFIKQILMQSPNIFGVGFHKKNIFKSFMEKNVGISEGKEWKNRRHLNNLVLCVNSIHKYAKLYNNYIKETLEKYKNPLNYDQFIVVGKQLISKIVFNVDHVPEYIFQIFGKANSIFALLKKNFKLDDSIYSAYESYLNDNIQKPQKYSLIELAVKYADYCPNNNICAEEILYQIPHWIFPMMSALTSIIPKTLMLLYNHPKELAKVIDEIKSIDTNDEKQIYEIPYLRKCILETVRLNNAVVTLFRTLKSDYNFGKDGLGKEYYYKKGTQFLILTNPILRESEKFENPNMFIPSRWNKNLEQSYYALMFSQGPQICPGKEFIIFVMKSFIVHYLKNADYKLQSNKIDTKYIDQMINSCRIKFFASLK